MMVGSNASHHHVGHAKGGDHDPIRVTGQPCGRGDDRFRLIRNKAPLGALTTPFDHLLGSSENASCVLSRKEQAVLDASNRRHAR